MKADFSPAYAYHLGYRDGRELGTKDPQRSFKRGASERDNAYFAGLQYGVHVTQNLGLEMCCTVHWDNPGFNTPECGEKASHIGRWLEHVLFLCPRHARQAAELHEPTMPKHWLVMPISWLGGDDSTWN